MVDVALVLVLAFIVWFIISIIRRNRRGVVAERGLSIGADLGALGDQPTVRVREVGTLGPDRAHVVLTPVVEPGGDPDPVAPATIELVVHLKEEDFGFRQLQEWQASHAVLAIVRPPGTRLVRLRSVDDLQPITLSCIDKT